MKYGMPTLVECADLKECVDCAVKYGLDFIEINTSFPQYQTAKINIEQAVEMARKNNLFYTIHADEQLNPFDFNEAVSECYFEQMREHIRFAKKLGAPVINMHLLKGVYVTLPGQVILLTDVYKDEYMNNVKRFIKLCEDEIGDDCLKICIENVDSNPFTTSQRDALELFMKSRVFGLTLDVGHNMCLNGQDFDVFETYSDKLLHMHLHDSNGKSAHLPLGSADVNVGEMLDLIDGKGCCLVEVKTIAGLDSSVEYLKTIQRF